MTEEEYEKQWEKFQAFAKTEGSGTEYPDWRDLADVHKKHWRDRCDDPPVWIMKEGLVSGDRMIDKEGT